MSLLKEIEQKMKMVLLKEIKEFLDTAKISNDTLKCREMGNKENIRVLVEKIYELEKEVDGLNDEIKEKEEVSKDLFKERLDGEVLVEKLKVVIKKEGNDGVLLDLLKDIF